MMRQCSITSFVPDWIFGIRFLLRSSRVTNPSSGNERNQTWFGVLFVLYICNHHLVKYILYSIVLRGCRLQEKINEVRTVSIEMN